MRTPTKRSPSVQSIPISEALLLSFPFPACIFDPVSGIVFYSNTYFNQDNSISLIHLLNKWNFTFLNENDIKLLSHRIKQENKFATRRLYFKNGQVKSVEVNLSVIPGHNLVLFFFTEAWSQESIFSKSTYVEELIQSISEGVAIVDENDNLTFCNRSFAHFFGRSETEILGSKIYTILHAPNNLKFRNETENLRSNQELNFEIKVSDAFKNERFILVHAISRNNKEGKYNGAFFTLMDITERVEMENELIINKDRALESDRLKTSFLTNMSHEIRTPMNCIIGFSALLKKKGLDWRKREQYLDIIISRGKHLMDILNNIIDISKLEENQIQLNNEDCNLPQILSELKEFYELELIRNKKEDVTISLRIKPEELGLHMHSDTGRLHQILTNLLNNAVKFTETGVIEIGYSINYTDEILFFVKDTGIGIDPEKQMIIFERFRQVDDSYTRSYGGTGLGLSICKGLLNLMGGRIWVESDGLSGSAFYFTLPLNKNSSDFRILENDYFNEMDEKIYDWSGRKILIVEDDNASYEFLSEVLIPTNCTIIHASNGTDALSYFAKSTFDLVLLDIQLPEVDGFQIANAIRKTNSSVPIIAQTAHAMSDDKEKCLNAGCNEYVTKPVHFEHLLETINNFLS